ncbi:DMT family transporter [Rhodobacteraceae bacterium D3-12]|nr:DMT family transporter [Rhodobacteraceae bacterium D3-12]
MSEQKSISSAAWVLIFSLGTIWGAIFLASRLALNEVGPLTIVAHRCFWAALALWGVVLLQRIPLPRSPRVWIGFLGMGILNNVIPFGLLNWSQQHIESGLASILNATTAVFGVLVAALFLADERLNTRKLIGVLIGFGGVATTIGIDSLRSLDIRSLAQLAALTATLSYAFAGVWARRMMGGLPAVLAAAGMLSASALVSIPAAWLIEAPLTLALSPTTLIALAYSAFAATALAYLLYYKVLELAGSGNLLLVTLLIPPFAIVLGALFLQEALPPNALAGFGLLALGLAVIDGRLLKRIGV